MTGTVRKWFGISELVFINFDADGAFGKTKSAAPGRKRRSIVLEGGLYLPRSSII